MWFKNLRIYRLAGALESTEQELEDGLASQAFRPCGQMELDSAGFVPPLGQEEGPLSHSINGCRLFAMRRAERLLPAAVVNEVVAEKVAQIEDTEGYPVRRQERNRIKDAVFHELLPQAFVRSRLLWAYLDESTGLLLVDAASANRAEEFLVVLREALGSLPVYPLTVSQSPANIMSAWLRGDGRISGLSLGDECELRDPEGTEGVVRCRGVDLSDPEVQAHLEHGRYAVRLALDWEDRLSFVLGDDFVLRRLRFGDRLLEERERDEADDEASRRDADFALMALELRTFLPRLIDAFGGIAKTP